MIEGQSIMVLCGDPSSPCNSLKVLEQENVEPIPVWSWPSLLRDPSQKMMMDFARDTLAQPFGIGRSDQANSTAS